MTLVERTQQFPGAQLTDDQVRRVFVKSVVKRPTIHERLMFWPDLHKSSIETVIEKAISLSLTAERVIRDVQSSGHGAPISRAPHKETGVERLAPSNFPRVTEQRFGFKTNQSSHHMETRTNAPPNSPKATEQRFGPKTNQGNHHIETKTNAQPWRRNQGRNNLQVSFADEALDAENNVHPDRRVNITPMDNNVKARRVRRGISLRRVCYHHVSRCRQPARKARYWSRYSHYFNGHYQRYVRSRHFYDD